MKVMRLSIPLLLVGSPLLGFAQADPAMVAKIIDEGKNRNQVMKHLTHLTQNIGPRLTSSTNLQKACDWTMQKFKEYGLQNVHFEQWGEWPVGFDRGAKQVGRMVTPYPKDFVFTTPSWTMGTNGPKRGRAVLEPTTMEEFNQVKSKLKGAWLVVTRPQGGGRGVAPQTPSDEQKQVQDAIATSGILGRVMGSRNELVITSGRWNVKWEDIPKDLRITIRKSDMDLLTYNIEKGRDVTLEFDLENKLIRGPRPVGNVIADIPGTEKPDEMVIVSGHLDSWDGPGSQGAQDNGTGTMVALEAARILMASGAKPKRTIRFIMWTGEEQGLFGSRAYVEKHKDELSKISCVFVDDGGGNYQGGLTCTADMEPMLREALTPAMQAFPDMPMEIRIVQRIPRGGGSDHASFNAVGVPGFFWFETGTLDYNFVHHTQHDRLEQVKPEYLVQSSTNSAAAAYIVACAPTLLPRERPAGEGGGGGG
jgi:carboxypeptidase Q